MHGEDVGEDRHTYKSSLDNLYSPDSLVEYSFSLSDLRYAWHIL